MPSEMSTECKNKETKCISLMMAKEYGSLLTYELGSKREAELYWNEFGSYWDATAAKFVREQAHKLESVKGSRLLW